MVIQETNDIIKEDVVMDCGNYSGDTKKETNCHEYKHITVAPQNIAEAAVIADYLRESDYVIKLDLQEVDVNNAQRIVDFVTGMVYMIEGTLQGIGGMIFIVTPNGYELCDNF